MLSTSVVFLLTPLREGRPVATRAILYPAKISTHAPAGGATLLQLRRYTESEHFYSRPCGRGDHQLRLGHVRGLYFYSRPCGRGDGRRIPPAPGAVYFYSRPCGRGDSWGRRSRTRQTYFYSRPCGRGDRCAAWWCPASPHFYSRPCGRGDRPRPVCGQAPQGISTHAPAGGATAIFHKSVMRFCGKLPKDDTVLCLASFGFPRRDPKAVYLAWISCANLPQKCVRQGLALKDQGTSCFHEGLASHAFDPVLV